MAQVELTSQRNRALRERVQRASGRVSELTERYLRGLGAELHDGPAQLIGLAALKVEHARRARTDADREKDLQALDAVLADAIQDIRAISKGLMLPELEALPLPEVIRRAVRAHEQRTGSSVAAECGEITQSLPHAVKICAYRFVQEGLNNAFRHAGGNGQKVACRFAGRVMCLSVEDSGGTGGYPSTPESGLGLIGLRERVESLGGTFRIGKIPGGGTRVAMELLIPGGRSE
nr:sensor histidine kinase [Microvirga makkahensis]